MELLAKLETALAGHDWYYNYSDDHRYYTKGRDEWAAITDMLRQAKQAGLDAEATALVQKYQPKNL